MKLSRLYTNKPDKFEPIDFVSGLNAIIAEIRLPENRTKDTHNLGKSTIGRLIDFCFLSSRDNNFFLFKNYEKFQDFVFFLEVELVDHSFITIMRRVNEPTKISFKKHVSGHQDFSELPLDYWDHKEVPFERARDLLDSILDWRGLKPWTYRKGLGYQLRSQDDFRDVFQLSNFIATHSDWKPYLAHILGFNAGLIERAYQKEDELKEKESSEKIIKNELGGSVEDISKVEGLLLLKQKEEEKKKTLLDSFDFRTEDKIRNKLLLEQIDENISNLNSERYTLNQNRKKIVSSLEEEQYMFNTNDAQLIFDQVGILFQGQIKKDFDQLLAFNQAITNERRIYLKDELNDIESTLKQINSELSKLGKQRSEMLAFLSETDVFNKYKLVSDEIVTLRADITTLTRQRNSLHHLQDLRKDIRKLVEECSHLQAQIEIDVEQKNDDRESLFSYVRLYFSEIIEEVISRKALLSVSPNKLGHLDFKAEILDESGNATSADIGHTYRKLLCIAFDLAVLRAHLGESYPRFVYHDGVFESLDDRKKENLLQVIRQYAEYGIQPIITLIDSDISNMKKEGQPVFSPSEVILLLHDEDENGRLFKTSTW